MEITYCDKTGLIYAGGVPFTSNMISRVKEILSCKNKQFDYAVAVIDSVNDKVIFVTPLILEGIEFIAAGHNRIASDEDFQDGIVTKS